MKLTQNTGPVYADFLFVHCAELPSIKPPSFEGVGSIGQPVDWHGTADPGQSRRFPMTSVFFLVFFYRYVSLWDLAFPEDCSLSAV